MSCSSAICSSCQQYAFSMYEYDGINLCELCKREFQSYIDRNTAKYVKEFIEHKPIMDFARDNGLSLKVVEDIFNRKFSTMCLDDLLLAVKVLPKMNMYDSIVLIGECFERIFALTKEKPLPVQVEPFPAQVRSVPT